MSTATSTAIHVLIFPYPAQGHMLPLLDLTHHLALRGLHLTILTTPTNLPILTPLLSAHPSIQTLTLPFPPHPNLPPGLENVRDIGPRLTHSVVAALSSLSPQISNWFHSQPNPPHALLSDFFLGWTHQLSLSLHIPRFAFFSSGIFYSAIASTLFSNAAAFKALPEVEFSHLPNSPVFKEEHLPPIFRNFNESDPDSRLFRDAFVANLSSHGSVFNTFLDLEIDYLEPFRRLTKHGRAYAVGPLGSDNLHRVNPDMETSSEVLTWLDECPDESVLYVSFGSQKWLTGPQLEALGRALERSGARFVWVVRPGADSKVAGRDGRGFVVKGWAPQVEILGHRAVGGFLSHCGWNSVLESVVAGVMVLAWPMEADQFVNARMLVEDMRVAVRVCEGPDTVPDPDELGRVIGEAMGPNVEEKERAKELKGKADAAVKEGGSSTKELDDFVNELVRIGSASC